MTEERIKVMMDWLKQKNPEMPLKFHPAERIIDWQLWLESTEYTLLNIDRRRRCWQNCLDKTIQVVKFLETSKQPYKGINEQNKTSNS